MAGQRINIMEVRTLISLKQKGWSNRKIAAHIKVNRKTVDSYISRFKALEISCEELLQLEDVELLELFTEDSQTEKERYETLAGYFNYFEKELLKPGCTLAVLHQRICGLLLSDRIRTAESTRQDSASQVVPHLPTNVHVLLGFHSAVLKRL